MRMIVCSCGERPITEIIFNRDDDYLFAASVDGVISLWKPETGERLGTYHGHRGAIFAIDVDFLSTYLISGGGDGSVRLWNVSNGKELYKFQPNLNRITSVQFATGDKKFLASTPQQLKKEAAVHIYDNPRLLKNNILVDDEKDPERFKSGYIEVSNPTGIKNFKISKAIWSPLNNEIYACCSDGTIRVLDVAKETEIKKVQFDPQFAQKSKSSEYDPNITDMKYCNGHTCIVATSRNGDARLFDIRDWKCIKTYSTDRGLNTVAVHPIVNAIAIGGGKSAQQAALKRGKGDYEVLLEHMIYEERMGVIDPECFSPLNTMAFNSDGSLFVLGYEEGNMRIFKMDANFDEKWNKAEAKLVTENLEDEDEEEEELY